jgi:hypothetical protein
MICSVIFGAAGILLAIGSREKTEGTWVATAIAALPSIVGLILVAMSHG